VLAPIFLGVDNFAQKRQWHSPFLFDSTWQNSTCIDPVYKSDCELDMSIEMDKSAEVMSPKNKGVMPEDVGPQILLVVLPSDKFVKKSGVRIGE
jgi:hypothetical protein